VLALAHRGLHRPHGEAPENTLLAFAHAVAAGVDGIETDVRLSRDGVPVLFHDRFVPVPGAPQGYRPVAALTAAELSVAAGYPVPTLDEALAHWSGILWNLEIKVPEAARPTLAAVRRLAATHRFLISSFWHPAVEPFAAVPGIATAYLLASRPAGLDALLGLFPGGGRTRAAVWSWEIADPGLLAAAAGSRIESWVYGVESEEEHRLAAALPLKGVITDRPGLLPRARR
jgi:glycerophosphoryl diester phosphodiesterase